jgi:hypothetical protein
MALKAERITGFPFLSETTQLEYRKVICALHTVPISLMNALLHERCQGDVARSILSNQLRRQRQKHKMFNASGLYCNGTGFRGGSSVCFRPRDCLGSCLGYSPESKFFLSNCLAFFPQWLCFCAHFRWRILLGGSPCIFFSDSRRRVGPNNDDQLTIGLESGLRADHRCLRATGRCHCSRDHQRHCIAHHHVLTRMVRPSRYPICHLSLAGVVGMQCYRIWVGAKS